MDREYSSDIGTLRMRWAVYKLFRSAGYSRRDSWRIAGKPDAQRTIMDGMSRFAKAVENMGVTIEEADNAIRLFSAAYERAGE